MTTLKKLKANWIKNPKVRDAYDKQAPEFAIAAALLQARLKAGYSQAEVAHRMNTTQSAIARMESGTQLPSLRSIFRYAEAVGAHAFVEIHR